MCVCVFARVRRCVHDGPVKGILKLATHCCGEMKGESFPLFCVPLAFSSSALHPPACLSVSDQHKYVRSKRGEETEWVTEAQIKGTYQGRQDTILVKDLKYPAVVFLFSKFLLLNF